MTNILVPRNLDSRVEKHRRADLEKIREYIKKGSKNSLYLSGTPLTKLPDELFSVEGSLMIANSSLIDLNNLKFVGNSLFLKGRKLIESSNNLQYVGDLTLDFQEEKECVGPKVEEVGYLRLGINGKCDLRKIKKIRDLSIDSCGTGGIILNEDITSLNFVNLHTFKGNYIFKHNINEIKHLHIGGLSLKHLNKRTKVTKIVELFVDIWDLDNRGEHILDLGNDIPEEVSFAHLHIYKHMSPEHVERAHDYVDKICYAIRSKGGIIDKITGI